MFDFLKNVGPTEIIILVVIIIFFFGSRIAVGIGKAAGNTLKEIKKMKGEITGIEGVKNKDK